MFVDEATITVFAGRGGDGVVAFRREKFAPRGGPSGGRGGRGGDVYLVADSNLSDLSYFLDHSILKAENGMPGQSNNKTGGSGKDLFIKVPVGVIVTIEPDGVFMADIVEDGQELLVAKGGIGGLGNQNFKNSRRQTPHIATSGQKGEKLKLRIELKLLADAGLVGMPNAGKSTLLGKISKAHPKIGDYPFTTLEPSLGVVTMPDWSRFTVADIPGLIEGASEGKGLGLEFLRHVERCRVLMYMVDLASENPIGTLEMLWNEIKLYSEETFNKPSIIVGNKTDLLDESYVDELQVFAAKRGITYLAISAMENQNLDKLANTLKQIIDKSPAPQTSVAQKLRLIAPKEFVEIKVEDGEFIINYEPLERIITATDLDSYDGRAFVERQLRRLGIEKKLRNMGANDGDTVIIGSMRFLLE
ncbi:MAG TPA: GTPase ObgE [Caldisericia bacterium]|nr:GTPase ObgE [Caldisericia bacterium]HPF48098.1 GTPase ObgE [Caldisericia bacterium]HPI83965.1 GTPase ObgE [Caldisericia bacterium]HPQ92551.1 GTPase ObgE [Caldisericia bacterium]HRV74351.1 GTPase ObgE [Caldisericia bacterium]